MENVEKQISKIMNMKNILLFFIILQIWTCKKKTFIDPYPDPPIYVDNFVIDSLLWEIPIDPNLGGARNTITPPIYYKNMVIFPNFEKRGYVALDVHSGRIIWDNRGKLQIGYFPSKPYIYENTFYVVAKQRLWEINMDTGNFIVHNDISDEDNRIVQSLNIYNDTLYFPLISRDVVEETFFSWNKCPINSISKENTRKIFRFDTKDFDNLDIGPGYSNISKNNNGEDILLFHMGHFTRDYSKIDSLDSPFFFSALSYNLAKDTIEWYQKNLTTSGWTGDVIVENERLYLTKYTQGVICLDINTGEIIWEFTIKEDFSSGAVGLKIIGEIAVLIGRNFQSFGLNKYTGQKIWENDFSNKQDNSRGSLGRTASFYNSKLYYSSGRGHLNSLNVKTGESTTYHLPKRVDLTKWNILMKELDFQHMPVIVTDDGIIVTTDGYRFLGFEVPDK